VKREDLHLIKDFNNFWCAKVRDWGQSRSSNRKTILFRKDSEVKKKKKEILQS